MCLKISKIVGEFKANLIRETAPRRLKIRNEYLVRRHETIMTYLDDVIKEVVNEIRSNEELYARFLKNCIIEALKALASNEILIFISSKDSCQLINFFDINDLL